VKLILALLAALAAVSPLRAWDPVGHMLTARIAYDRLTPEAKTAVDQAIAEFNRKNQTAYTFVTAACWMDDLRSKPEGKAYAPWHYINLPFVPDVEPEPGEGKPPNVLWGMERCLAILRGETTDENIDRNQALVMLVHLIGDCHQPLHTTSRQGDAGGNKVDITNLRDPLLEIFPHYANLHFFWDSSYRRVMKDGFAVEEYAPKFYPYSQALEGHTAAQPLVGEQAAKLLQARAPESLVLGGTPAEWVRESHKLGYDLGYQKLPGGEAADPTALTNDYVNAARACAQERIVQAGGRIAETLNAIYAPRSP